MCHCYSVIPFSLTLHFPFLIKSVSLFSLLSFPFPFHFELYIFPFTLTFPFSFCLSLSSSSAVCCLQLPVPVHAPPWTSAGSAATQSSTQLRFDVFHFPRYESVGNLRICLAVNLLHLRRPLFVVFTATEFVPSLRFFPFACVCGYRSRLHHWADSLKTGL